VFDEDVTASVKSNELADGRLRIINNAGTSQAIMGAELRETWGMKGYRHFLQDVLNDNPHFTESSDEEWMIPEVFYLGGFDLVQFVKIKGNPTLRFLQNTTNMNHSFKPE
jgi:hypothetical protein